MPYTRIEAPTGAVDGVNRLFTVSIPYTAGSMQCVINGLLRHANDDDGWVETSPAAGTVTLNVAYDTGAGDRVGPFIFEDTVTASPIAALVNSGASTYTTTPAAGDIKIVKGQDFTFGPIQTADPDGVPIDLTGAVVYFAVKRLLDDDCAVAIARNSSGNGITVTTPSSGVINAITLVPSNTSSLVNGSYQYDIWIKTAAGLHLPVDTGSHRFILGGRAVVVP